MYDVCGVLANELSLRCVMHFNNICYYVQNFWMQVQVACYIVTWVLHQTNLYSPSSFSLYSLGLWHLCNDGYKWLVLKCFLFFYSPLFFHYESYTLAWVLYVFKLQLFEMTVFCTSRKPYNFIAHLIYCNSNNSLWSYVKDSNKYCLRYSVSQFLKLLILLSDKCYFSWCNWSIKWFVCMFVCIFTPSFVLYGFRLYIHLTKCN